MKYLRAIYEAMINNRERQAQSYINAQRFYY
jgi:hypothetical protein